MKRKVWYKRTTAWITLWAMVIVTYMLLERIEVAWASSVVMFCSGIILAYVGGHQVVDVRHGPETTEENSRESKQLRKMEDQ